MSAQPNPDRAIIWTRFDDGYRSGLLDDFRLLAERAAEMGATHLDLGQVHLSMWQMRDARDPHPTWGNWPVWSIMQPTLFKFHLPPALAEWIPADDVARNRESLLERAEIMRAHGLRAAFFGNDPMWLPEGVFVAHPEWRGAQAEAMTLARLPFFSPCVDHPEVREMFRWSMEELCRDVPELDFWSAFTNDSGGGLCWSGSYPGDNGPKHCRHISHTERVVGFLSTLQEGARAAGSEVEVALTVASVPPPFERAALQPGQYYNGADGRGRAFGAGVRGNDWFGNGLHPVVGIPRMRTFVEEMESARAADSRTCSLTFGSGGERWLLPLYAALRDRVTTGPVSRLEVLRDVAAARVGVEHAEKLVEVWELIERAVECQRHVRRVFRSILLVGAGMMRWLLQPLVPDQTRLSEDEKELYRRWKTAKNEVEADSYHQVLGWPGIVGEGAAQMGMNSLWEAMELLRRAEKLTGELAEVTPAGESHDDLVALSFSLRALVCGYQTCHNFIAYEEALAQRGRTDEEVTWRDWTGTYVVNRGGFELRDIARNEADNVIELARLIEEAPRPVVARADSPEGEHAFVFAPDLPAQLRRKAAIMWEHWVDYNEYYPPLGIITATQNQVKADVRPGQGEPAG